MSMMLDLGIVKKDFTSLMGNIHPWMLSHFVMWLDIKVAEYKVYGHMVLGLYGTLVMDRISNVQRGRSWASSRGRVKLKSIKLLRLLLIFR